MKWNLLEDLLTDYPFTIIEREKNSHIIRSVLILYADPGFFDPSILYLCCDSVFNDINNISHTEITHMIVCMKQVDLPEHFSSVAIMSSDEFKKGKNTPLLYQEKGQQYIF